MKTRTLTLVSTAVLMANVGAVSAFAAQDEDANSKSATSTAKVEFQAPAEETTPPQGTEGPDGPENPDGTPVDPEDGNNSGTGMKGPLSLDYVPNIDFGNQEVSSKTQSYNAKNQFPYVQVTDNTGSVSGWNVTVSTDGFTSDSDVLKGAELTFAPGQVYTPGSVSTAPEAKAVVVGSEAKTIFNAKKDAGAGTWINQWIGEEPVDGKGQNDGIQLKVIGGTAKAKAYTADLVWTITAGPNSEI
ncbi:WxL domain-containing protein [Enterococcus plantarum]|uniref:WxL domain-containing protein n=1 Tax=Enterococcus plantarum TaxID=1077675 RepID=UPI001A8F7FF0|nr:WxL domain-containing protein [Enterococcus plantarum]MBO0466499.1 WxL domain-containing protein [Enterococcus plantarum]